MNRNITSRHNNIGSTSVNLLKSDSSLIPVHMDPDVEERKMNENFSKSLTLKKTFSEKETNKRKSKFTRD